MLCSRDLHVLRAQRITDFFLSYYPQIKEVVNRITCLLSSTTDRRLLTEREGSDKYADFTRVGSMRRKTILTENRRFLMDSIQRVRRLLHFTIFGFLFSRDGSGPPTLRRELELQQRARHSLITIVFLFLRESTEQRELSPKYPT